MLDSDARNGNFGTGTKGRNCRAGPRLPKAFQFLTRGSFRYRAPITNRCFVQRAAGSAGEMNLGVTSVAAPRAASSRTARYPSTARPVASAGSPLLQPPVSASRGKEDISLEIRDVAF